MSGTGMDLWEPEGKRWSEKDDPSRMPASWSPELVNTLPHMQKGRGGGD